MVALGFGWLSYQLFWLPGTVAWMSHYLTNVLAPPLLVWLALVYPSGRFRYRLEWIVVVLAWILWAWGRTLNVLTDDPRTYCLSCPHNVLLASIDPSLQLSLGRASVIGTLLLVGVVVVLLLLHWSRATSRGRRSILPLLWVSGPPVAWEVYFQGAQLALWPFEPRVNPWSNLALVAVPLGYVYARVRDQLTRGGVAKLIIGLGSRGQTGELGPVPARTLHDPSVVVGYWKPEEGQFADVDGREVAVPNDGDRSRKATLLELGGEPLAVIIHDAAVDDDPRLLTAATAAVSMAMENEQLHALVLAQLDEVRASRARIVTAQDDERRRLERDLHDGAQQNLVALKIKVGLAEMLVEKDPARAKLMLAELKVDTDEALQNLRDLARGVYPPLLADKGLVAALESQARKATVPVEVVANAVGRYPQEVEAAVYFCCLEALQNVQKYAFAQTVVVRIDGSDRGLSFEVTDDGQGFDGVSAKRGAGLTNMTDRIDALGGHLEVSSTPEFGTRIQGSLPALVAVAPG